MFITAISTKTEGCLRAYTVWFRAVNECRRVLEGVRREETLGDRRKETIEGRRYCVKGYRIETEIL